MITYPLNNVEYSAEDAELFHCTRTSGVWAKDDFPFSVTGADNSITVGTGIAWINNDDFSGKVVASKETTVLDLGIPDSVYPRIDVVAIQFDANANETKLVVKKGTPASFPLIPAISRTASLYELYLCRIERPAGAAVVSASSVSDLRLDPQYCGLMADSVTSVNTEQINRQIDEFIEKLRDTIDDVQSGAGVMLENYWSEDGKIPVLRGGTGRDELTENSFLVGNGTNPAKLITPSEAREAMGLGKSTGLLGVPYGGTGREYFTADYFLRGNGNSPVKTSTPEQVLNDIEGQKRIQLAHIYMDGRGQDFKAGDNILFNKSFHTDNGEIFYCDNDSILLKKAGLYLISSSVTIQINEKNDTVLISIMKGLGSSKEDFYVEQHDYSIDLVYNFNCPITPLQVDNQIEISIKVILGNGYINQYPLSHLTAIYLG